MPDPVPPEAVNPDDLMAGVKRHSFLVLILISVAVHIVLIFGTSIRHIGEMRKYKTLHPAIEKKRLAKLKREEEMEARRRAAHEKFMADQAKKKSAEKDGPEKGGPAPTTATKPGGEKPKVLKDIEAKSTERPKESSLKLDELDAP